MPRIYNIGDHEDDDDPEMQETQRRINEAFSPNTDPFRGLDPETMKRLFQEEMSDNVKFIDDSDVYKKLVDVVTDLNYLLRLASIRGIKVVLEKETRGMEDMAPRNILESLQGRHINPDEVHKIYNKITVSCYKTTRIK